MGLGDFHDEHPLPLPFREKMIYGLGVALEAVAAIVTLQFTYGGPPIFKGVSVPSSLVALSLFGVALFIFAYRRMKKHVTRSWGEVRL